MLIVGWWRSLWLPFSLAYFAWCVGVQFALLNSVEPHSRGRQLARATGLVVATLAVVALFPHYPVFVGSQFNPTTANAWEYARSIWSSANSTSANAAPAKRIDEALVELNQPALLEDAVARLAPQTKGKTDIYAIGIAGSAQESVFIKDLNGAFDSVRRTLPIEGRTLHLINHVDSVSKTPVATRQNFAAAIRAVSRIMDKEEDILLLFMTSHGFTSGVVLWLPGITSGWLSPADVASVLDREESRTALSLCRHATPASSSPRWPTRTRSF